MSGTTAGWYPDPYDSTQMRWFDGQAWTESTQPMVAAVGQAADASAQANYSQPAAAQSTGWSSVDSGSSASSQGSSGRKNTPLLIGGAIAAVVIVGGGLLFATRGGGDATPVAVETPVATASADASAAPTESAGPKPTTVTSAADVATSMMDGSYLDGVLQVQPGTYVTEKVEERDTETGYAADATYKNVADPMLPQDAVEIQSSVSWYTADNGARDAYRAQFDQEDAVFIEKTKSQFTTKSPYLDGLMMVRTVRDEGQYLVTALCAGPTDAEASLITCTQNVGNAQARTTGTQFGVIAQ